jgi:hypothetical protein
MRSWSKRVGVIALGGVFAAQARAQDPGGFSVDSVLVATFSHDTSIRRDEVAPFEAALAQAFANRHLVIGMAEVAAYADYSASMYLQACPEGRYEGCAQVVGERAQVDWVVGGEVARDGDALAARVIFIDVKDGELLGELLVPIADGDDAGDVAQVEAILAAVIQGELDATDARVQDARQGSATANAAKRKIETSGVELEDLERGLGEVERTDIEAKAKRVTQDDLDAFDGREDAAPWERLHMNRVQYARYRNGGGTLDAFRKRMQGRQFELLIGTGFAFGVGPWTQRWEGWYGLDQTLTLIERATSLDQTRGMERTWSAELGFGLLPWLSVTGVAGTKITDWMFRVQQITEGETEPMDEPQSKVVGTFFAGGRLDFAPFPTFPARPTISAGAQYWQGTDQSKVMVVPEVLPLLARPNMVLVEVTPGFEVELGRNLLLWGRMNVDLPVAGRRVQQNSQADERLIGDRPTPTLADDGVGLAGAVGITGRIRLVQRHWRGRQTD